MRVRSALLVSLVGILLLSVGPAGVTALAQSDPGNEQRQDIHIELQGDGDARWEIKHHYVLTNESERDRFEAFAEEIESGQRDAGPDAATFVRFVPYAEEGTSRSMSIEDDGWDSYEVRQPAEVDGFDELAEADDDVYVGTITYAFTWTNFARTENGHLYLQDAFLNGSGHSWFNELKSSQRLIIEPPEEHDYVTAPQGIDNNRLVWDGPAELDRDDFEIVLVSRAGPLAALLGIWPFVLGSIVLLILIGGAIWYIQQQRDEYRETGLPDWWPSRSILPNGRNSSIEGPTINEPTTDQESENRTTDSNGDGSTATEPGEDEVDPGLLSDEERVTRLLNENGGRMKQAAIVDETGWSNAKVSQLLSQMDDDDEIKKLRIGRENLITLPDVDPTQVE